MTILYYFEALFVTLSRILSKTRKLNKSKEINWGVQQISIKIARTKWFVIIK